MLIIYCIPMIQIGTPCGGASLNMGEGGKDLWGLTIIHPLLDKGRRGDKIIL